MGEGKDGVIILHQSRSVLANPIKANIWLNTIQSKPAGGVGNERDQWAGTEEHKGCRQMSVCVNHRGQQERLELPLPDPTSGFSSSPRRRSAGAAACPERTE